MDPWKNLDGSLNLYGGISVCTTDKHVHVKCDPTFIGQLFVLLEPELNNIKEERHAKNIEKAQKEVLICIALTLFQRFERIQQKLLEAEKTRDLLFLSIIDCTLPLCFDGLDGQPQSSCNLVFALFVCDTRLKPAIICM